MKMERLNFEYIEYYSESGWINQIIFFNYFSDYFLEMILEKREKLKKEKSHAIIFLDNHGSHFDKKLCLKFFQNNIHLVLLPPNCTHILQPLDVGFFPAFKSSFRSNINKSDFPSKLDIKEKMKVIIKSLDKALYLNSYFENIKSAFSLSGISPINFRILAENGYITKIPLEKEEEFKKWIEQKKNFFIDICEPEFFLSELPSLFKITFIMK